MSTKNPLAQNEFDIFNTHYTFLPGTEKFYIDNPEDAQTLYSIIGQLCPTQFKSLKQNITPPDDFFKISKAGRRRILRTFQLENLKPPETNIATPFIPLIDRVSTDMEMDLTMPAEYKAALWATQYDQPMAASLILYHGWATSKPIPIASNALYTLIRTGDGIVINIEYPHTFNDRLQSACAAIYQAFLANREKRVGNDLGTLLKIGMQEFFFYQKRFVSATNKFNMMVKGTIQGYITRLLANKNPPFPVIEEPYDVLPEEPIILKWDDFQLGTSTAQTTHIADVAQRKLLAALQQKCGHLPQGVSVSRAELGITRGTQITAAIKYGYLTRETRGYYILNFPKEGEDY